jgi:hypothetical protein
MNEEEEDHKLCMIVEATNVTKFKKRTTKPLRQLVSLESEKDHGQD